MKIHSKRRPRTQYLLIAAIVFLALVAAGYFAMRLTHENQSEADSGRKSTADTTSESKPDTAQSIADKKTNSSTDTPIAPQVDPVTKKQSVDVVITDANVYGDTVETRGFVTNSAEQSGVCNYVFTKGSMTITKRASPLANPTSTTCEAVKFPAAELEVGTWSVTLEFSSDISYGKSAPREFSIK